jgi:hypothetical protein
MGHYDDCYEEEDKPVVESINIENGQAKIIMRHPLFTEWVKDMLEMFDESGAVNFLELCCGTPERGNFVVTIQRLDGKTPGQIVAELKQTIADMEIKT